jgi:hypothetical protein
MTKRVWLDDVRVMPAGFDVHVETAEALIELLKTGDVSHVSFDNDLGEGRLEGRHAAAWVEEAAFNGSLRPITWAVHSANPIGRREITAAMESADRFWGK